MNPHRCPWLRLNVPSIEAQLMMTTPVVSTPLRPTIRIGQQFWMANRSLRNLCALMQRHSSDHGRARITILRPEPEQAEVRARAPTATALTRAAAMLCILRDLMSRDTTRITRYRQPEHRLMDHPFRFTNGQWRLDSTAVGSQRIGMRR